MGMYHPTPPFPRSEKFIDDVLIKHRELKEKKEKIDDYCVVIDPNSALNYYSTSINSGLVSKIYEFDIVNLDGIGKDNFEIMTKKEHKRRKMIQKL